MRAQTDSRTCRSKNKADFGRPRGWM